MKVCSTTFLSLSWSKLIFGKTGSTGFKTGSTGFCTVHLFSKYWFSRTLNRFLSGGNRFNRFLHCSLFSASLLCQPKSCAQLFENRFNRFWDRFNRFLGRKVKTASFGAPPIYTHSYLSPHRRARTKLHSQPEKHLPLSLTHLLPLPFQIFGEEIFEWVWELRFLCFISKSLLLFLIRALVLHRVLCGFITLGASSS